MPLIYVNYPTGAIPKTALDAFVDEITTITDECEGSPKTAFVRSTTWVYLKEYAPEKVYHGGTSGGTKVISFEVNVLTGGFDAAAKKDLIARCTTSVRKHAGMAEGDRAPVYILIREVPGENWGLAGEPISLEALMHAPVDAKPF